LLFKKHWERREANDNAIPDEDNLKLFYTTGEKEEFF
jgi:hypothetical protein